MNDHQHVEPIPEAVGDDYIPRNAQHWRREHYIPICKTELVDLLSDELAAPDQADFRDLCRKIDLTVQFELHRELDSLKQAYEKVNPDPDTLPLREITHEDREASFELLFDRFESALLRANFHRLSREQIEDAVGASSHWGVPLDIDFDVFDRLVVFARGDVIGKRVLHSARNFFRPKLVEVPTYQRVAAIYRLREHDRLAEGDDTRIVYLKFLKNVPKEDVDMMLPGGRVKMSLLDGGKIILPTVSGVAIATIKVLKGALLLAFAGIYGFIAFIGLVAGTIGYGVKSFFGYRRIMDTYELNRTRSLYFQNLDNNAGVLFRVIDESHDQEFRETVLAYYMLWKNAPAAGWSEQELDEATERKLRGITGLDIDFQVDDAVAKLNRYGLATQDAAQRWHAVPIETARENTNWSTK
ncbi:MAG: DUF3754 domain-containing protein [Pirellulaceae bacterium]